MKVRYVEEGYFMGLRTALLAFSLLGALLVLVTPNISSARTVIYIPAALVAGVSASAMLAVGGRLRRYTDVLLCVSVFNAALYLLPFFMYRVLPRVETTFSDPLQSAVCMLLASVLSLVGCSVVWMIIRSLRGIPVTKMSMTCHDCGYLLYGLTEPRCPECGTHFDPKLITEEERD